MPVSLQGVSGEAGAPGAVGQRVSTDSHNQRTSRAKGSEQSFIDFVHKHM